MNRRGHDECCDIRRGGSAAGVPFTVADLERTPDDGRRHELLDGTLVVSPRPAIGHQRVGFRLAYALEAACPDGLIVVPEPAVQVNSRTELARTSSLPARTIHRA